MTFVSFSLDDQRLLDEVIDLVCDYHKASASSTFENTLTNEYNNEAKRLQQTQYLFVNGLKSRLTELSYRLCCL